MNQVKTKLSWLGIFAVIFVCSSLAQAQANCTLISNCTWVASAEAVPPGNDANAAILKCAKATPCRTIAAALGVTNAKGSINVVDGAEYNNGATLAITKSVTIDGNGVAVLSAPNTFTNDVSISGLTVNDIVVIRNMRFNGFHLSGLPDPPAHGVNFAGAGTLVIENDHFNNFSGAGVNVVASGGVAPGPGQAPAALIHIRNSFFDSNDRFGVSMTSTGPGRVYFDIDGCHIENNGAFGSGTGVFAQDLAQGMISNSVIGGNQADGILTQPTVGLTIINVESCVVVHNNRGVDARSLGGSSIIRISNVDIFENESTGIDYTLGNFITSFGNNRIAGNGAGNGPPTNTLPQQ